jgi:hypothetical protein
MCPVGKPNILRLIFSTESLQRRQWDLGDTQAVSIPERHVAQCSDMLVTKPLKIGPESHQSVSRASVSSTFISVSDEAQVSSPSIRHFSTYQAKQTSNPCKKSTYRLCSTRTCCAKKASTPRCIFRLLAGGTGAATSMIDRNRKGLSRASSSAVTFLSMTMQRRLRA